MTAIMVVGALEVQEELRASQSLQDLRSGRHPWLRRSGRQLLGGDSVLGVGDLVSDALQVVAMLQSSTTCTSMKGLMLSIDGIWG